MCVDFLLEAGANKDIRDDDGNSALTLAIESGDQACIELLLQADAASAGGDLSSELGDLEEKGAKGVEGAGAKEEEKGTHGTQRGLGDQKERGATQDREVGGGAGKNGIGANGKCGTELGDNIACGRGRGCGGEQQGLTPGSEVHTHSHTHSHTHTRTHAHTHKHTHKPQVAAPAVSEQVIEELCESFSKQKKELELRLDAKDKQLGEKDKQLEAKDKQLEAKDKQLDANCAELRAKDQELGESKTLLKKKVVDLKFAIDGLRREKEVELALLRAQLHDDGAVLRCRSGQRLAQLMEAVMQEQMQRRVESEIKLRLEAAVEMQR